MVLVYNSFGEKTEEIAPSPDGGQTPGPLQKWGYDADGNMVSYVNPMGQEYFYKYNDRNERVEEDDPSPDGGQTPGPVWTWSYNAAGELIQEVDPMRRVTQWVHDGDGDVTQTIAPNVTTGAPATPVPRRSTATISTAKKRPRRRLSPPARAAPPRPPGNSTIWAT